MKKITVCIALASLLALGGQAFAVVGALDDVPAATLLVPYFEVELDNAQGVTTLFEINNASAAPQIAHVTLWTDWSVPTLDFNVFLTGYDVVAFNLRDLFDNGTVPQTAHNNAGISPTGLFSLSTNPAIDTSTCSGQLPLPALPPILLTHIRNSHTGQPSAIFNGSCAGEPYGDNRARGYITIDVVDSCTLQFPGDAGYFAAGGTGIANNDNVLWGNVYHIDPVNNFAQGETMVAIEADDTYGAPNYTFYGRYSAGTDNREPLGTVWASRFIDGGAFSGGTQVIAWRDARQAQGPTFCGSYQPGWAPLGQNQIVIFDEAENPDVPEQSPFSPAIPGTSLIPFPLETQRTQVGGPSFPVPFAAGWLYLNLNVSIAGATYAPYADVTTQSYVNTTMSALGQYSVSFDGFLLDDAFSGPSSDLCLQNPAENGGVPAAPCP